MGLRFARRIKIAKGLNLNISKSGLGLSVGARGASISMGPKGTHLNTGIPGTGISKRTSIGNYSQRDIPASQDEMTVSVRIEIDDETGKESVKLIDQVGNEIVNESILRKVKRTEGYKIKVEEMREKLFETKINEAQSLIEIYKYAVEIIDPKTVKDEFDNLQPLRYEKRKFNTTAPTKKDLETEIRVKAHREVKTWKFWEKSKLIDRYINEKIVSEYEKEMALWNQKKNRFEEEEELYADKKNTKYQSAFEEHRSYLKKIIDGESELVENSINSIFEEIQLPIDFSVSFEYKNRKVFMDVDLPEIEDYPTTYPQKLQSGKVSIKKKTISDVNEDYARSVIGIAFYFASLIFNVSPAIEKVTISGYTQRISKKTGQADDEYVYMIDFDREKFSSLHIEEVDPILAIQNFPTKINLQKNMILSAIDISGPA
jgi:hypothetical protein